MFEDDGTLASAITSVVHDARRNLLFLSGEPMTPDPSLFANAFLLGVFSDHLTVCKVD